MAYAIKDFAFRDHEMEEYTISEKVNAIGWESFAFCRNLKQIVVPENVKKIGSRAFMNCTALETVVLEGDFKTIGGGAFALCPNLKMVDCNAETLQLFISSFKTIKNQISVIYDYLRGVLTFSAFPNEKTTRTIKRRKEELIELIMTNDDDAGISGMLSFWGEDVDLEYLLGKAETAGAVKVKAVLLEASKHSEKRAINELLLKDSLENKTVAEWKEIFSLRNTQDKTGTIIIKYKADAANVVIPEKIGTKTVIGIESSTFEKKKDIVSVVMPDTITILGHSVFSDCIELENVRLSKGLKKIGGFKGCARLAAIGIPEGAETISLRAFDGCVSLCNIYIPSSVNSIGADAFRDCHDLVIHTPSGSYTEKYARKNSIKVITEIEE